MNSDLETEIENLWNIKDSLSGSDKIKENH